MRKPFIAGNWKMHGSLSQVRQLLQAIKQNAFPYTDIDIAVLPPFPYLAETKQLLNDSNVGWGAQNLYVGAQGAYTGEVSGSMLAELGCRYVLVGHSERRTIFGEDEALVAAKFKAAIDAKLTPILCVGETKTEREQHQTEAIIARQIQSIVDSAGIASFQQAVIAYEPVWAIGTGLTASPDQAQAVHAFIRDLISQNNVDLGLTIRILYGGSMKPENAAALLMMPDIDGGLIGGASLDATSFLTICAAASQQQNMAKTAN